MTGSVVAEQAERNRKPDDRQPGQELLVAATGAAVFERQRRADVCAQQEAPACADDGHQLVALAVPGDSNLADILAGRALHDFCEIGHLAAAVEDPAICHANAVGLGIGRAAPEDRGPLAADADERSDL